MDERESFERHARALLARTDGMPASVLQGERRLAQAIRDAGLAHRLPHLLAGAVEAERRADEPFEIFVMGEGKFGKSTLVNALLGVVEAPMDVEPKTWCFNRYVALPHPLDEVRMFVDMELMRTQNCDHLGECLRHKESLFRGLVEYRVSKADAAEILRRRNVVGPRRTACKPTGRRS